MLASGNYQLGGGGGGYFGRGLFCAKNGQLCATKLTLYLVGRGRVVRISIFKPPTTFLPVPYYSTATA